MLVRMKPATYTQYTTVTERLGLVKFSEFRISQNFFKRLKRTLVNSFNLHLSCLAIFWKKFFVFVMW